MNHQLKQEIIDYAYSIGIDSIGFTTADPFDELKQKLVDYHEKGYASVLKNQILRYEQNLNYLYPQRVLL